MSYRLGRWPVALLVAGGLAPAVGQALEWDLSLRVGSTWSDNADRDPVDGQVDWRHSPSASASLRHAGKRLQADLDYRAEYTEYRNDSQEDRDSTTGQATVAYDVIPGRLRWSLVNIRAETTRNAAQLDIQDNLQVSNVIQTGPEVTWPLGPRDTLTLVASAARTSIEDTANDSNRASAQLRWSHRFSERLQAGLSGRYNRVDYDISGVPDLKTSYVALQGSLSRARLEVGGDLGWNETRRSGRDTVSGFAADLSGSYQVNRRVAVQVSAARQLTDQAARFSQLQPQFAGDQFQNSDQTDVFLEERVNASLSWEGSAVRMALRAGWNAQDYETVDRDRITRTFSVDLRRPIGRRLQATLNGRYQEFVFSGEDRDDDEYEAGVGLTWTPMRQTSVGLRLSRRERSSDNPQFDYDENMATVSLGYRLSSKR